MGGRSTCTIDRRSSDMSGSRDRPTAGESTESGRSFQPHAELFDDEIGPHRAKEREEEDVRPCERAAPKTEPQEPSNIWNVLLAWPSGVLSEKRVGVVRHVGEDRPVDAERRLVLDLPGDSQHAADKCQRRPRRDRAGNVRALHCTRPEVRAPAQPVERKDLRQGQPGAARNQHSNQVELIQQRAVETIRPKCGGVVSMDA